VEGEFSLDESSIVNDQSEELLSSEDGGIINPLDTSNLFR